MKNTFKLQRLEDSLTVCKLASMADIDATMDFFFLARTDEEISMVCRTTDTPENTVAREDGWKGFRIVDVLDFSIIGVLSQITEVLARERISVFAVSTFNTDYVLVKVDAFDRAARALSDCGYEIIR